MSADEPATPLIESGGEMSSLEEMRATGSKKFLIRDPPFQAECFIVMHEGRCHAYRNICPHAGTPLDWTPNEFFGETHAHLQCRTHGAVFMTDSGKCIAGPCAGDELIPIALEVAPDGTIRLG